MAEYAIFKHARLWSWIRITFFLKTHQNVRLEIPIPFVSIHCITLNCAATTMSVIEVGSMLSTSFNSIPESFSSNEIAAFRAQCENMLDGYVKLCYSYLWGASNLFVDCMKPITIFL